MRLLLVVLVLVAFASPAFAAVNDASKGPVISGPSNPEKPPKLN